MAAILKIYHNKLQVLIIYRIIQDNKAEEVHVIHLLQKIKIKYGW